MVSKNKFRIMSWNHLKPAVHRNWLIALAGLMWTGVGVMLCRLAFIWLTADEKNPLLLDESIGAGLAVAGYYFGLSRVAHRNIKHLCMLPEKAFVLSFLPWKSYLMIGMMMITGITLRTSAIPKLYLAILYIAMGGSLILGSLHYHRRLWRVVIEKKPCHVDEEPEAQ